MRTEHYVRSSKVEIPTMQPLVDKLQSTVGGLQPDEIVCFDQKKTRRGAPGAPDMIGGQKDAR